MWPLFVPLQASDCSLSLLSPWSNSPSISSPSSSSSPPPPASRTPDPPRSPSVLGRTSPFSVFLRLTCLHLWSYVVMIKCPKGRANFDAFNQFETVVPMITVSGEILEKKLGSDKKSAYFSVLFYASWCPFSHSRRPTFDALSSMFPPIKHFLVEESSVMPSVFSRYGIHSFPALMLINGTTRLWYQGSNDLTSLVYFYKRTTGLDPVMHLEIELAGSGRVRTQVLQVESARELITKEPYLAFSVLFIFLRMSICFISAIYTRVKAFCVSHAWHLNLRFLCESSHLLEQVLHLVDVKLCNRTRNLRKGANNARVWASSLASVSLGEPSTSKLTPTDPQ